jgi:hypothetical protein
MDAWIAKHGRGFMPADEDADKAHARMEAGECAFVRFIRVRDPVAHRRYWKLMTLCAENCERIELERGQWMPIRNKDDVHAAIKLCTGFYDPIFDAFGSVIAKIPKSTSFADMTKDEWASYWPRVLDVVQEKVMPGVDIPEVEYEIQKCMGLAA